ncbi:oxygen-dependent protoporphyrinogen oxidase [Coemansia sp. RSA 2611]|nr:oxygen-dependent protoporphyrinogen oxidase [Coemansia sp. RSA 2611]
MPTITILGGGITGLSTAWYLAQRLPPTVGVKLIEGSSRLGGWMRTDKRRAGGVEFIVEKGPRTLRTGSSREATAVLELVDDLELRSEVITAPRTSAAARNRYIYYNGELNCMPTGLGSLITGLPPAVKCLPRGVWRDLTTAKNTPMESSDESIHDFISRRFGEQVDDNLASAVMHGIYASDTRSLSARALLFPFWLADRLGNKGMLRGLNRVAKVSRARQAQFAKREKLEKLALSNRRTQNTGFWETIDDSSMYSFRHGIQTLSDRLARTLRSRENIEIVAGQPATAARVGSDGCAEIVLANGRVISSQHVINTLPLHRVQELFGSSASNTLLDETPYASVAVVNVAFGRKNITPVDGFGYLVPRASAADSKALGTVFDSCALPDQDGGADITRLTVMLGGPRFNELFGSPATVPKAMLENVALEALRNQLGLRSSPIDVDATVNASCIPSYTVGYIDRLKAMQSWVQAQLGGRMSVVGAAYGGPAVPQCIIHARDHVNCHLNLNDLDRPQNVSGLQEIIDGFEIPR